MRSVLRDNSVFVYKPSARSKCTVAGVYSNHLVCLFPQHGRGPKHSRPIALAPWQADIVAGQPERFLRGLIHADGSRFMNRVNGRGKVYVYPRYNFTNASEDILTLFTATCDQLGIAWRRMNARNISVAKRESVARVDSFVGPKF